MKNTLPKSAPAAFTLTELLVVISLIVLLLAIAVPAFHSMLYNNDRSLAENQLKIAIATARDQAIRSDGGDTAAVFLYQPGGKLRIVTCVSVATIEDEPDVIPPVIPNLPPGTPVPHKREIFVPISIVSPVDLPRGWAIRAYVPPQAIDTGRWYGTNVDGGNPGPLEARYPLLDGCWVFPETGFYDSLAADPVNRTNNCRTSFMVRFEAGTGALVNSKLEDALVIDLAPLSEARRTTGTLSETKLEQAADLTAAVRRLLATGGLNNDIEKRRDALGDRSRDTILVRPVSQLAILDERKMVQQFGQGSGQLNRATNSIYGDPANTASVPTTPRIDTSLFGGATPVEVNSWVSQWIVGSYQSRDGAVGEARIFNIDKASGLAREVTQ